jgi:hypothetical protein
MLSFICVYGIRWGENERGSAKIVYLCRTLVDSGLWDAIRAYVLHTKMLISSLEFFIFTFFPRSLSHHHPKQLSFYLECFTTFFASMQLHPITFEYTQWKRAKRISHKIYGASMMIPIRNEKGFFIVADAVF